MCAREKRGYMDYNALEKLNAYRKDGVAQHYEESIDGKKVLDVQFQTGGSATTEKNGVYIEDLLIVAYAKLDEFNKHLPSRENSLALTKIEEAILWLTARKVERVSRSVYGTEEK